MPHTTITELDRIEDLTRAFSKQRAILAERVEDLEAELLAIKRRKLRGIRSALAKTKDAQSELENVIAANPEAFVKPRTVTIDGVRVGLAKGKGRVTWADEQRVVELIDRHFPDRAETLVKTTRKPIRSALGTLTTAELRKIGCTVTETGDQIVIKPQDSELDKLIGRLLDETKNLEDF